MRRKKFVARLLITSLLLFFSMANIQLGRLFDTTSHAGTLKTKQPSDGLKGKLSGELDDAVAKQPNGRIRVIIQTKPVVSRAFSTAVGLSGGKVNKSF